jgi:hypothetical protein
MTNSTKKQMILKKVTMMVNYTAKPQAMTNIKKHKNIKPHYNYNDTSTVNTKNTEVETVVTQNESIAIKLKKELSQTQRQFK